MEGSGGKKTHTHTHTHIQRGEMMAYEFCDPLFLGSIWEAIVIPLHRCVCIWTTFLVCLLLLSSLCGFGLISFWVGTYLGQLSMTLDNNNNNIHSMVVGDVVVVADICKCTQRFAQTLCFLYLIFFFCQMYEFTSCRVSRKSIQCSSFPYKLRSISGAFFSSSLDLTDDDDHYFTQ